MTGKRRGIAGSALAALLLGSVLASGRASGAWPGPDWAVSFSRTYGGEQRVQATCVDSSGTAYCIYLDDGAALRLVRMIPPGIAAGDVPLAASGASIKRMAVDGAGYVVAAGEIAGTGTDIFVAKFDPADGSLQGSGWPVQYNPTGAAVMTLTGLALDSSDSVLVGGHYPGASDVDSAIAKFLPDGSFAWESLENFGTDDYCAALAADPSDNVFLAAACFNGVQRFTRVKAFDSAGTAWGGDVYDLTDPSGAATDDNPRALSYAGGYLYLGLDGTDAVSSNYVVAAARIDPVVLATNPMDGSSASALGAHQLGASQLAIAGGVAAGQTGTAYVSAMTYDSTASPPNYDLLIVQYSGTALVAGWSDSYDSGGADGFGSGLARAAAGVDPSGNFYLAAAATNSPCAAGTQDWLVQAYDEAGTKTWSRNYDNAPPLRVLGVTLDAAGNEYVGIDSGENPAILQYDASGVWQRTDTPDAGAYCRSRGAGIASDGLTTYMALSVFDPVTLAGEARIAGFDGAGTQTALYTYDAVAQVRAGPLAADATGNLYLAAVYPNAGSDDIMAVKIGSGGSVDWDTPLNETTNDSPSGICVGAGGIYILQTNRDASPSSYRVTKLDSNGNKLWGFNYAGSSGRAATAYAIRAQGWQVLVTGTETDISGNSWGRMLTLSPTGAVTADRSYNGGQDAGFRDVAPGGQGILYLAGNLGPAGAGNFDMHALSLGAGGVTRWATTYDSGAQGDFGSTLAATGATIFVAGEGSSTAWLLKYTEPPTGALAAAASVSATALISGALAQVTLTVTNWGGAAVANLDPKLEINSGSSFLLPVSGPIPINLSSLPAGSATNFVWTFSVSGSGTSRLTSTVTGTDSGLGVALFAAGSVSIRVLERASLEGALATQPGTAYIGTYFTISITVTNTGDIVANAVTPAMELNSGGAFVSPATGPLPAGPVEIGPNSSQTFVWTYSVTAEGAFSFTVSVTGKDGIGGDILVSRSASVSSAWPAALSSALTVAPISPEGEIGVGQWLTIELDVSNTGASPAYSVTGEVTQSGTGVLTFIGYSIGPVTLDPGDSTTFIWTYSVSGAGTIDLSVSASGQDLGAGITLWSNNATSFEAVYPAELVAPGGLGVLASPVRQGQTITVTLFVSNVGDLDAWNVTAKAAPKVVLGQPNKAILLSGPDPAGPITLVPGAGQYFTWIYRADISGTVYFTATASGTDELSGMVAKAIAASGPVLIDPAALMLLQAQRIPERPKVGTVFDLWLEAENSGDIAATGVVPVLSASGDGVARSVVGPQPAGPLTIASGEKEIFSWRISADRIGAVAFTFTISGTEAPPSGYPVLAATTITIIIDAPFDEETVIYPNPIRSQGALPGCEEGDCFRLVPKLDGDATEVEVDVYDSGLHRVYSGKFGWVYRGGSVTVQGVRQWAPGIYLLRVRARLADGREQEFPVGRVVIKR